MRWIPLLRSRMLFPLAERLSGRNVNSRLAWLHSAFNDDWEQRKRLNRLRLIDVLQNAKYEIPFYKDLFRQVKFDPLLLLKDVRYFQRLPVLTKEDIREAGARLLHPDCQRYLPVHISRTNGSTGSALPIYYTPAAKDYSAAVTRLSQHWVGFSADQRQLHISSAFPGQAHQVAKRQEWWRQQATNRISLECDAWTEDCFAVLWKKICKAKPYIVQGHPSTLYALARHVMQALGPQRGYFAVFVSTGETLTVQQRRSIEETFGCRVANRYGNAEFGIMAHERFVMSEAADDPGFLDAHEASKNRFMQVVDPYIWMECLGASAEGAGSLVVTDLTNYSSPLIRYATGDEGALESGVDGLYLKTVTGRVHDKIEIAQRSYPTHWFQDFFTRLGVVDDFQFLRTPGKQLELRICLLDPRAEMAVRNKLAESFSEIAFDVSFVERSQFVRVGQQQKFRYLVELDEEPETAIAPKSPLSVFSGKNHGKNFLYLEGWYSEEKYATGSYRWMRRQAEILLNPEKSITSISVTCDYPADSKKLPVFSVRESGKVLYSEKLKPGAQHIFLELPGTAQSAPRTIVFDVSEAYQVEGDTRELGLKVHDIAIS